MFTVMCRINEYSQTSDQYFSYILRCYQIGINQDRGIAYDVYRFYCAYLIRWLRDLA